MAPCKLISALTWVININFIMCHSDLLKGKTRRWAWAQAMLDYSLSFAHSFKTTAWQTLLLGLKVSMKWKFSFLNAFYWSYCEQVIHAYISIYLLFFFTFTYLLWSQNVKPQCFGEITDFTSDIQYFSNNFVHINPTSFLQLTAKSFGFDPYFFQGIFFTVYWLQ